LALLFVKVTIPEGLKVPDLATKSTTDIPAVGTVIELLPAITKDDQVVDNLRPKRINNPHGVLRELGTPSGGAPFTDRPT
jgi:hypothetical protein